MTSKINNDAPNEIDNFAIFGAQFFHLYKTYFKNNHTIFQCTKTKIFFRSIQFKSTPPVTIFNSFSQFSTFVAMVTSDHSNKLIFVMIF